MRRVYFQKFSERPALARRARSAFTLIELIVVITIIVALIAILLPALGHLKNKARSTQTQNLMTTLMHSIDSYFTRFEAYPGPIPAAPNGASADSTAATGGSKALSGSQNMLLGLSFAMTASSAAPNVQIGASGTYVNPANASGPVNYAVTLPTGLKEQLPAFFSPALGQLSPPLAPAPAAPVWPLGGMGNSNAAKLAFPVVLDTYPDGLPILYYRRTPGVDVAAGNDPITAAAYYLNENSEYTGSATLKASSGTPFDQTATPFGVPQLAAAARGSSGTNARGGYLLISAGVDRFYGKTDDNIVVVGGN